MAMPWKKAKALIAWHRESPERIKDLNALFDACFRIQLKASKAAGHYIPLVVENVKGAQPWVGRAKAHYGSYYLWGDVEDVGGRIVASGPLRFGQASVKATRRDVQKVESSFQSAAVRQLPWVQEFGLPGEPDPHPMPGNPARSDGIKVPRNDTYRTTGQKCNKLTDPRYGSGVKQHGSGAAWFDKALDERRREASAVKNGHDWFGPGEDMSLQRRANSKSSARKAASAAIAEIPFELASYIARAFRP